MKSTASIQSMTGFANTQLILPNGIITLEIKSVNSRFLDIHFKLNDEYRIYEQQFREIICQHFQRGKIECRLQFQAAQSSPTIAVDHMLIANILSISHEIQGKYENLTHLSMADLLRWPGVLMQVKHDNEQLATQLCATLTQCCQDLQTSRCREGQQLANVLKEKINQMQVVVEQIKPLIPTIITLQQQKIKQRLQDAIQQAGFSADNPDILERILQESTLFGIRVDIAEELTRLETHLHETNRILTQGGNVGKRLDFMMQELNREANTVGSKASVIELSDASMQLKLLIEQMREQIQNLE